MPTLEPSSIDPPQTTEGDPRLGHFLPSPDRDLDDAISVMMGFPVDEGVRRNGGRPGATLAPDRIRTWLYKMTPDARRHDTFVDLLHHTHDLGNLIGNEALSTKQNALGTLLGRHLRQGRLPILLGGGHETAFGHFLGYVEAEKDVSILNWDAHTDVRPLKNKKPHSGSPFRQALEHPSGHCRQYTVAGLLPHSTAAAHLRLIEEHDGRFLWVDDVTREAVNRLYQNASTPLMVTFDLDAVDQAHAPGVSAPAVGGLSQDLWLYAAYTAGRSPSVTSIDLVELNPTVDIDSRTARLAALTVMEILRGLCDRPPRG